MTTANATARRPARWDVPFSEEMSHDDVERMMRCLPFSEMVEERFPRALPLREILRNDARIVEFDEGDIVIREGDYGSSAFLLLSGEVLVCLEKMTERLPEVSTPETKLSLVERLLQLWRSPTVPEYRKDVSTSRALSASREQNKTAKRLFVQDIPRLLDVDRTIRLQAGEIFGELAALTRTPRTATVLASSPTTALEIRWQGLRDLIRFDRALQANVERLYRQNSLNVHLRETSFLADLPDESIQAVADGTRFESYGEFDWQHDFRASQQQDVSKRVATEPKIASQGDYPDGLILIRSGFARLSQQEGVGESTIAYLGKGHCFGIEELWHNWRNVDGHPLLHNLRAIGYVDILRIPTDILEDHVFPHLDPNKIEFAYDDQPKQQASQERLEFLVDQRLMNGTQAMVIDLDRCTRCDDCVRACAAAHDNNPRFVRAGATHDGLMYAGACMHCVDPVCMIGCPTGAIGRVPDTGTVVIRDDLCIGCSTCANSCPYDNIRMVEIRDAKGETIRDRESGQAILKATKCDLCNDVSTGPACQNSCPHDALVRIDLGNTKRLESWTNR